MTHTLLQNIICKTLKQGDMIVLYSDSINNIHYKLGLNIYIGIYNICYSSLEAINVVEYFYKHIINHDSMDILESWLVTFQISLFCNLWKMI